MKEIEKDVNIEVEDNDDIVFIPSVDSKQAAPTNLKVTLLVGTQGREVKIYVHITVDSTGLI